MTAFLIIIFTLLALSANVIFFKIKFILKDNDYDVDYFFWHFPDIPNFIRLIRKTNDETDKKAYLTLLTALILNVLTLAGLITLSVLVGWI